eukprot:8223961-Alexandrium_andersonii.AAC.1
MGSDAVPGALEGPILRRVCRAEREYGIENLPGAPWGLVFVQLVALSAEVVLITSANGGQIKR